MRFPFGHAIGEPGAVNQQLDILYRAFRLLFEAESPGTILDSRLRWKRESYAPPDWEAFRKLAPHKY